VEVIITIIKVTYTTIRSGTSLLVCCLKRKDYNIQDRNLACGCLTLREEHRLFENRVLRRTFGRKRDEVKEGCRTLHDEEFRDLHSSSSIIRR
jgi:hypothetical protein